MSNGVIAIRGFEYQPHRNIDALNLDIRICRLVKCTVTGILYKIHNARRWRSLRSEKVTARKSYEAIHRATRRSRAGTHEGGD
jgi:hypothetical protein